ncbi:molybdate ABC transporter substrate-binding protein [Thermocrinis minervae]|uniref:Molybdate transport system substrate-binding protein n=1 Tax=Thermocrinis minervae TaxID=381751 RepID=A0A1M6SLD7_9AQUI|nr:molybdate ABC transporter substrate-binding protein [Thermocrinis minervae]SHK45467.1 molybdate transport system substrate-binding protein [Thermocrinis minervae]
MKKLLFFLLLLSAFAKAEVIRVFAAADLQYALKEVTELYEQANPEDKVELIFGSSGKGTAQIKSGAPYHLFFSADMKYVEELYREGYIVTRPKPYAVGRLVLWTKKDSGLNPSDFPQVLMKANKIAVANWEHAPYGRAAKQVMEKLGLFERLRDKLVLGENVSQTASFVYSGAADIGFIPLSLAVSSNMQKVGVYYLVPENLHERIVQGYGVTKYGSSSKAAMRFYNFVAEPKAKQVLKKYGFETP